jgi:hypothetical protein
MDQGYEPRPFRSEAKLSSINLGDTISEYDVERYARKARAALGNPACFQRFGAGYQPKS